MRKIKNLGLGENRTYDSVQSRDQDLTFATLEKALKNKLGIKKVKSGYSYYFRLIP